MGGARVALRGQPLTTSSCSVAERGTAKFAALVTTAARDGFHGGAERVGWVVKRGRGWERAGGKELGRRQRAEHSQRLRCHMWREMGWSECARRRDRQLGRQYASQRKRVRWRMNEVWCVCRLQQSHFDKLAQSCCSSIMLWLQGEIKGGGLRSSAFPVFGLCAHFVDAASVPTGDETTMQFNAAVIPTTFLMTIGTWALTTRARDKLAAVRQLIEEYDISIGAMFELNGSRKALDLVVQWFRGIGLTLRCLWEPKGEGRRPTARPRTR